jgi:hypothetical protein
LALTVEAGDRGVRGAARDPERSAREAGRRASVKVRRYCAANGLSRLWTLTFAEGCWDLDEFWQAVNGFVRRMREHLGGEFPYVVVPEDHVEHGLHAHVAVGVFVEARCVMPAKGQRHDPERHCSAAGCVAACGNTLRRLWGHGFTDARKVRSKRGGREASRLCARYVAKYVAKGIDEGREFNRRRYSVAKGFQPEAVRVVLPFWSAGRRVTPDDLVAAVEAVLGRRARFVWASSATDEWEGPPTWVVFT